MGCSKCGGDTEGYKCDMCGAESAEHDAEHACGGDHCIAKCKGCSEAESKCTCGSEKAETGEEAGEKAEGSE